MSGTTINPKYFFRSQCAHPVETIKTILNPSNEKKQSSMDRITLSHDAIALGPIFGRTQQALNTWINGLSQQEVKKANAAPSIGMKELKSFYQDLKTKNEEAYQLCETCYNRISSDFEIQQAVRDIGNIVFAAERLAGKIKGKINPDECGKSLAIIYGEIEAELKKIKKELIEFSRHAFQFSLQSTDAFLAVEKPKVIANLAITQKGQINFGIIHEIKRHFFEEKGEVLEEYDYRILFVLNQIDCEWQKVFDAMKEPKDIPAASKRMVYEDLGLSPKNAIFKRALCAELLTGMLSLYGGSIGDRFTISVATKNHKRFLHHILQEFKGLIEQGCLSLSTHGFDESFFFDDYVPVEQLSQHFALQSDGALEENSIVTIWECPNLMTACLQMGMDDLAKHQEALLVALLGPERMPKKVTWLDVLHQCAKIVATPTFSEERKLALGKQGFALDQNRLIKAWEVVQKQIAESNEESPLWKRINDVIGTAVHPTFQKCKKPENALYAKVLVRKMEHHFLQKLNRSFRLIYNEQTSKKCFKLYQKQIQSMVKGRQTIAIEESKKHFNFSQSGAQDEVQGRWITDQQELKESLEMILSDVYFTINEEIKPEKYEEGNNILLSASSEVNSQIGNKDFVKTFFKSFNLRYSKVLTEIDRIQFSSDSSTTESFPTRATHDFFPDLRTLRLMDAEEFLKWLLNFAVWKESMKGSIESFTQKETKEKNNIFTLDSQFENEEFKAFLSGSKNSAAWIRDRFYVTGRGISRGKMDKELMKNIQKKIVAKFPKSKDELNGLFESLFKVNLTVQQCSERLFYALNELDPEKDHSQFLDSLILGALPEQHVLSLCKNAMRFAKVNEVGKELATKSGELTIKPPYYYCLYFNPRTETIQFGCMSEDKKFLQPIDQKILSKII